MARKQDITKALQVLTSAGFQVTLTSSTGKSVTATDQGTASAPPAPKQAQTKASRSKAQPRVKHCSLCGGEGHNKATCARRQAQTQTPPVDMTTALLDGVPAPQQAPQAPAEPEPLDFLNLSF